MSALVGSEFLHQDFGTQLRDKSDIGFVVLARFLPFDGNGTSILPKDSGAYMRGT